MQKTLKIALLVWSVIMLFSGILTWTQTIGALESTEFILQIAILNKLAMLMIWLALFTAWRTFDRTSDSAALK